MRKIWGGNFSRRGLAHTRDIQRSTLLQLEEDHFVVNSASKIADVARLSLVVSNVADDSYLLDSELFSETPGQPKVVAKINFDHHLESLSIAWLKAWYEERVSVGGLVLADRRGGILRKRSVHLLGLSPDAHIPLPVSRTAIVVRIYCRA